MITFKEFTEKSQRYPTFNEGLEKASNIEITKDSVVLTINNEEFFYPGKTITTIIVEKNIDLYRIADTLKLFSDNIFAAFLTKQSTFFIPIYPSSSLIESELKILEIILKNNGYNTKLSKQGLEIKLWGFVV